LLPGGLSGSAGPQIVATEKHDKDGSALRLQDRGAFKLKEACEYLGGPRNISCGATYTKSSPSCVGALKIKEK